jgi:transposase
MPAPVPVPIRRALGRRWEQGATTAELSRAFAMPPRTVRSLVRRWREKGEAGLQPNYRRHPPQSSPEPAHPAFPAAVDLRREHPTWGAGLIRVRLIDVGITPPSERTLQRWFRRAGLAPAPSGRRPVEDSRRATRAHETWQVDAAERIPLADGPRASWLRIADEASGAVLGTAISPPRPVGGGSGDLDARPAPRGVRSLGLAATDPGR